MLGSDYPFPLGELIPGELIESMDFNAESKDWLLHKSALDWLNLPQKRYEQLGINHLWMPKTNIKQAG